MNLSQLVRHHFEQSLMIFRHTELFPDPVGPITLKGTFNQRLNITEIVLRNDVVFFRQILTLDHFSLAIRKIVIHIRYLFCLIERCQRIDFGLTR